jgi:hypothetical protein
MGDDGRQLNNGNLFMNQEVVIPASLLLSEYTKCTLLPDSGSWLKVHSPWLTNRDNSCFGGDKLLLCEERLRVGGRLGVTKEVSP